MQCVLAPPKLRSIKQHKAEWKPISAALQVNKMQGLLQGYGVKHSSTMYNQVLDPTAYEWFICRSRIPGRNARLLALVVTKEACQAVQQRRAVHAGAYMLCAVGNEDGVPSGGAPCRQGL